MNDLQSEIIPEFKGHRQRLKYKLINSPSGSLLDYEILELVLMIAIPRADMKPLAKDLINYFGSLAKVLNAKPEHLRTIKGTKEGVIAILKTIQEAANRLIREDILQKPILESWVALLHYCRSTMGHLSTEQFRIIYLDRKNQLIRDELQEHGTIDHTPIYPREITKKALLNDASSIILIHNHPTGNVTPSSNDISTTMEIQKACAIFNIKVHDHVIISNRSFYSLKSHGLL
jgi:DNA repair protein RadC